MWKCANGAKYRKIHDKGFPFRKIVARAGNKNCSRTMVSFEKIENVARKIGEQTKAQAVVLFGSCARNQAGMHSDVDLTS